MPPRNCEGDLSTKIGLDHGERQIHPCGHARGCPNAAILDVDRIAFDDHRANCPVTTMVVARRFDMPLQNKLDAFTAMFIRAMRSRTSASASRLPKADRLLSASFCLERNV
jgi:hypothetical protein